jgi:hypothetical protein
MTQPNWHSIRSTDIAAELSGAQLHDLRLSERGGRIAEAICRSPAVSLPQAMANDAELMAAYRFFNNPKVSAEALVAPHAAATAHRAAQVSDFLVISDTAEIQFLGEKREELGDLSAGDGFFAHLSIAVARVGDVAVPLGTLALQLLTRDPARKRRTKSTKAKPLFADDNEFRRWPIGIQDAGAQLARPQDAIHVMDREGDNYAFLAWLAHHGHRYVVRSAHDRTPQSEEGQDKKKRRSVSDSFAVATGVCQRTIHIGPRKGRGLRDADKKHPPREERDAVLSFAARRVRLAKPHGSKNDPAFVLPPFVDVNVVRVWEENPPAGEKAIEWLLFTSEPVDTVEQILTVVDIYRCRWLIEEFIKSLKTGCAVEQRGFLQAHALKNVLALTLPVAWQMIAMRALSRLPEPVPASAVLTPTQLEVLHDSTRKLPPRQRPPANPTVRAALFAIAALGGHVTRNGEPGWLTIARGFHKLRLLTDGYVLGVRRAATAGRTAPCVPDA